MSELSTPKRVSIGENHGTKPFRDNRTGSGMARILGPTCAAQRSTSLQNGRQDSQWLPSIPSISLDALFLGGKDMPSASRLHLLFSSTAGIPPEARSTQHVSSLHLAPDSGLWTTDEHHPVTCASLNSASGVPWKSGYWSLMFSHGELLGPLRGSLGRRVPDVYFVCYSFRPSRAQHFQLFKYPSNRSRSTVLRQLLRLASHYPSHHAAPSCIDAGLCFSVHGERRGSFRRSIPHSTRQFAFPGQDASSWRLAISSCAAVNAVHPVKSVVTVNRQEDHRSFVWPSRLGISSRSSRVIMNGAAHEVQRWTKRPRLEMAMQHTDIMPSARLKPIRIGTLVNGGRGQHWQHVHQLFRATARMSDYFHMNGSICLPTLSTRRAEFVGSGSFSGDTRARAGYDMLAHNYIHTYTKKPRPLQQRRIVKHRLASSDDVARYSQPQTASKWGLAETKTELNRTGGASSDLLRHGHNTCRGQAGLLFYSSYTSESLNDHWQHQLKTPSYSVASTYRLRGKAATSSSQCSAVNGPLRTWSFHQMQPTPEFWVSKLWQLEPFPFEVQRRPEDDEATPDRCLCGRRTTMSMRSPGWPSFFVPLANRSRYQVTNGLPIRVCVLNAPHRRSSNWAFTDTTRLISTDNSQSTIHQAILSPCPKVQPNLVSITSHQGTSTAIHTPTFSTYLESNQRLSATRQVRFKLKPSTFPRKDDTSSCPAVFCTSTSTSTLEAQHQSSPPTTYLTLSKLLHLIRRPWLIFPFRLPLPTTSHIGSILPEASRRALPFAANHLLPTAYGLPPLRPAPLAFSRPICRTRPDLH
ncbi:uncharacterized protein CLUP02_05352 [Colletotrichum lupini]|uniref:Uncharacterized protein n=1 Tax=Colletotrichum lupini TaxID=145971 RepID=A0A9Q8SN56_9PEZI|nr:uncharacterized protein CLUP02_05352 [Colletotrichum lupini]UQC79871.1 hypothetical protein CLUP02_05352 [Colletotrichum lupini]